MSTAIAPVHDLRLATLSMALCLDPELTASYRRTPLRVLADHGIDVTPDSPTPALVPADALAVDNLATFTPDPFAASAFTWQDYERAA